MSSPPRRLKSVCVFCGSSGAADSAYLVAAAHLGAALAHHGMRLVYGGGGTGLMGACARAARAAGGEVLGVMPQFLMAEEHVVEGVTLDIVGSMHERKLRMFEESDGFAVLPGAIGTLEEAVELLSWRRLGLHAKPIVFYNPGGFWDPLFTLFAQFQALRLIPPEFSECWAAVDDVDQMLRTLESLPAEGAVAVPLLQTIA